MILQNLRAYRSAQFFNTDYRLAVATVKFQLKSRRMVPSQPRLDVGRLEDERVAEEFANKLSGDLVDVGVSADPKKFWSAFKNTILHVAGGWLGTHRKVKRNVVSQGTLNTIDQSRRGKLNGRSKLFSKLRCSGNCTFTAGRQVVLCTRNLFRGRASPVVK